MPIAPTNQMAYNNGNFSPSPIIQPSAPPPQTPPSPSRGQQFQHQQQQQQNRNAPAISAAASSMHHQNGNTQVRQQQLVPPQQLQDQTPVEKKRMSNIRTNTSFANLVPSSNGNARVQQQQQQQSYHAQPYITPQTQVNRSNEQISGKRCSCAGCGLCIQNHLLQLVLLLLILYLPQLSHLLNNSSSNYKLHPNLQGSHRQHQKQQKKIVLSSRRFQSF